MTVVTEGQWPRWYTEDTLTQCAVFHSYWKLCVVMWHTRILLGVRSSLSPFIEAAFYCFCCCHLRCTFVKYMYMVTWHSRILSTTPYVVDMKDIGIGRSYRCEMWETPPRQSDTTMFIPNLVALGLDGILKFDASTLSEVIYWIWNKTKRVRWNRHSLSNIGNLCIVIHWLGVSFSNAKTMVLFHAN